MSLPLPPVTEDADLLHSESHTHMIDHLTGPFQVGAVRSRVAIDNSGRIDVAWVTREPLLLLGLKEPLGDHTLRIEATVPTPDGLGTESVALEFANYTETGAFLPLLRPPANEETRTAAPFVVTIASITDVGPPVGPDGVREKTAIPTAAYSEHVEAKLLEGVMGRMIYLLGAEKQRVRRMGREIAAMRRLAAARDDALDRIGAELGVPRFTETLVYQPPDTQPSIFRGFMFSQRRFGAGDAGQITTLQRREPDNEYRRRLRIYRPWLYPNSQRIVRWLNGIGQPADPNAGTLGEMGLEARFTVTDADDNFAVAVHLIGTGTHTLRNGFLGYTRQTYLVWPADDTTANDVHDARYIPVEKQAELTALRRRLRTGYAFPTDAAIAPMLAIVLDRVSRCRRALGGVTPWTVMRAQSTGDGSRYELGLGVDVPPLPAAELASMRNRLQNADFDLPVEPTDNEPAPAETEGLLLSMSVDGLDADPDGIWLLEPCGLRTVHRIASNRLYLSHFPTFGMTITGPGSGTAAPVISVGTSETYEAHFHAAGEPGSNVVLVEGLAAAADAWADLGGDPWSLLSEAGANAAWGTSQPTPPLSVTIFEHVGLPVFRDAASVSLIVDRLRNVPAELLETLQLSQDHSRRITAGRSEAIRETRNLVNVLSQHGMSSALMLIVDLNTVLAVVGATALPGAGLNLSERGAAGFRWYAVPILPSGADRPQLNGIGSTTRITVAQPGLFALIAMGYARRGGTDPYEFRVELPDDARLNLLQYEFLMNLLAHLLPIGTRVDTAAIRQRHVDLDNDGDADPLDSDISRTYRRFQRHRYRGEIRPGDEV